MKRMIAATVVLLSVIGIVLGLDQIGVERTMAAQARPASGREVPKFKVDPGWLKVPSKWILGIVSSSAVDAQDHVWVLQRPLTLAPEEKPKVAPPVLEFDAAGNFIQAWGGPGQGYDGPPRSTAFTSTPEGSSG